MADGRVRPYDSLWKTYQAEGIGNATQQLQANPSEFSAYAQQFGNILKSYGVRPDQKGTYNGQLKMAFGGRITPTT